MTVVGASLVFLAITNVYSSYLRAFGFAGKTLISAGAANIFNIAANGIFIYLGMGIFGVALATFLSRILDMSLEIMFSRSIRRKIIDENQEGNLPDNGEIFREIIRIGLPSAGELIVFNLSISFELSCLNQMDAEGTAAGIYSYCNQICNLIYCAAVSLSQANGIIVGWRIGEQRYDDSYRQTMQAVLLGITISGIAAGIAVWVTRPILSLLTSNEAILSAVTLVMAINVAKELGRAGNYILGTALKSSGDATITVIMGIVSMPTCAFFGSYILGLHFGMGIYGAWTGMAMDECIRCIWMFVRYRSRKWEKMGLIRRESSG